jgi:ATP-dependent Clp protease ATP-binding subunit ClpA
MEAINRLFAPEFRNRLDGVVRFHGLAPETISSVVDKFIIELESQLEGRRVTIEVDEDARAWLAEHGYDAKMGARPMARLIQDKIRRALADELLFGKLVHGGLVSVGCVDGELKIECEPAPARPARVAEEEA